MNTDSLLEYIEENLNVKVDNSTWSYIAIQNLLAEVKFLKSIRNGQAYMIRKLHEENQQLQALVNGEFTNTEKEINELLGLSEES